MTNALILVDIQNDFLPGGTLAVPDGDAVIPVANQLLTQFELVFATQDWHPSNHGSFASQHDGCSVGDVVDLHGLQQMLWPDHCVQGSRGAEFSSELQLDERAQIFPKGTDITVDSYSGFFDNGKRQSTGLGDALKEVGVSKVFVAGLATDYCVKFTALDARELGFDVMLIEDGCRGVNLQPDDVANAIQEMRDAGIKIIHSNQVPEFRS